MYIEKPKKIVLVDKNKEEGNSGSARQDLPDIILRHFLHMTNDCNCYCFYYKNCFCHDFHSFNKLLSDGHK